MEGRQFHIATDHKPITFALSRHSKQHSPHQVRHLDFIAQFTIDIRRIKGADNTVADTLSRVEIDGLQTSHGAPLDFEALAKAQQEDKTQPDPAFTSLLMQVIWSWSLPVKCAIPEVPRRCPSRPTTGAWSLCADSAVTDIDSYGRIGR